MLKTVVRSIGAWELENSLKLRGEIRALGEEARVEMGLPSFNPGWFFTFWCSSVMRGNGEVWVAERNHALQGILCAVFWMDDFTGRLTAQEKHWFVTKSQRGIAGGRLLLAFHAEADRRKCDDVFVSRPTKGYESFKYPVFRRI